MKIGTHRLVRDDGNAGLLIRNVGAMGIVGGSHGSYLAAVDG